MPRVVYLLYLFVLPVVSKPVYGSVWRMRLLSVLRALCVVSLSDDVLRRIAIRPRHAFIAPIKRFFRRQLQPAIIDIVLRLNTGSKHIDDKLTAGPFRCPAEMTTVTNDLTRAVHLALYDAPHLLLFFYRLHALLTLLILQCNALLSPCALFPKKITHPYVHLPSSPFKCPFTFCPDLKGKERKGDQYRANQCKGVSR